MHRWNQTCRHKRNRRNENKSNYSRRTQAKGLFWDIYELSNTFSLKDMIEWATTRDEWSFTEKEIEAGFKKYPTSKNVRKG